MKREINLYIKSYNAIILIISIILDDHINNDSQMKIYIISLVEVIIFYIL